MLISISMQLHNISKYFLVIILVFSSLHAFAQDPDSQNDNAFALQNNNETDIITLQETFEDLIKKSNNYLTYKVIPHKELTEFWNQTLDTLKEKSESIKAQQKKIDALKSEIELKKDLISQKDMMLEQHKRQEEVIEIFGIALSKSSFKIFTFITFFILLGVLVYVYFLYKQSHLITKSVNQTKDEIEELLSIEKKKRSDDIHRLKRELQTERNLVYELQQKKPS